MYSVLQQEKTALRDGRGATVYRRLYLCDTNEDLDAIPTDDAPGSGALVAEDCAFYILNNSRCWCYNPRFSVMGGNLWSS